MNTPVKRLPCFGTYEIDKAQERRCSTCKDSMDCASQDEQRMDVIGQNGNTGDHYNAPTDNSAPGLLKKAALLMTERARQYDAPGGERSMGKAVQAFNAITGQNLTEAEGWLMLQVLKDVRQWQKAGYHADSAEDCIAYAALKAEALATRG